MTARHLRVDAAGNVPSPSAVNRQSILLGFGHSEDATSGKPYIDNGLPTVIVRDLNNMFMNLQQSAEPATRPANR